MDYKKAARELVSNLNHRMNPSAYDIAWMARLRTADGSPRWPDLIDWLLDNQYNDGSWGGEVVYYHERIISTLAAIVALKRNGFQRPAQAALKRGERYIWQHLHLLSRDPFELAGFELLLPTLLLDAQQLNLDVPAHTCGYGEIQNEKLRLIPAELLYSQRVSTIISLEFLGQMPDRERLRRVLGENGAVGNSPSATAYYLSLFPDETLAWKYLETIYQRYRYAPFVYPFRNFDLVWTLNSLRYSGRPLTEFAQPEHWVELQAALTPQGISIDSTFLVMDGDSTSVTARLLAEIGCAVDPAVLAGFQDDKTLLFRTYAFERNSSISTNVHALEALHYLPQFPERAATRDAILTALMAQLTYNLYWIDKWNASPYYATSHALVALLMEGMTSVLAHFPCIDWLLHTQRPNGAWGFFQISTAEETAYALVALLHYHRRYHLRELDVVHRAADYLAAHVGDPVEKYPPLYIGKVLYAPYDVVRATILGALILYEDTVGHVP
ncbi:Type B diterpene cyclase [Thermoflexales bacterium]|nr:Type B diterpene cyclase [Thermoflexales bacterium]